MGSTFVIGAALILFTAGLVLLGIFQRKFSPKIRNLIEKIKAKLLWNAFIRYSL